MLLRPLEFIGSSDHAATTETPSNVAIPGGQQQASSRCQRRVRPSGHSSMDLRARTIPQSTALTIFRGIGAVAPTDPNLSRALARPVHLGAHEPPLPRLLFRRAPFRRKYPTGGRNTRRSEKRLTDLARRSCHADRKMTRIRPWRTHWFRRLTLFKRIHARWLEKSGSCTVLVHGA